MDYTYNDKLNEIARNQMLNKVQMGKRRLSYEAFKRKAREHQVQFRKNELCVGYYKYPNVLNSADARKGLIFFEGFRHEIMDELNKPITKNTTSPSAQMLANLLRSEHIPYNIFFPMKKDREGCKNLFNMILGTGDIQSIQNIFIEYHPEPIKEYLDDHTAFDVYIPYIAKDGQTCGIGIEVKYTEKEYPLKPNSREYSHVKDEHGNTCLSTAYARATEQSKLYRADVSKDIIVSNRFRQIWRNHILGASMVLHGDIARFTSITLYPQENIHFSLDAMPAYKKLLTDKAAHTCVPLSYENLFDYIEQHLHVEQKDEWLAYLRRRYLFSYSFHLCGKDKKIIIK